MSRICAIRSGLVMLGNNRVKYSGNEFVPPAPRGGGNQREPKTMTEQLERIVETFEFFQDWEDRYNYMAELGQKMPAFPEADRIDANKVQGCVSQVWITVRAENGPKPVLHFAGDSDTSIIKGIVAILLSIYSGKTAKQALEVDVDAIFERLGIFEHLSPNRHVGVYAMVEKFRDLAGGEQARLAA